MFDVDWHYADGAMQGVFPAFGAGDRVSLRCPVTTADPRIVRARAVLVLDGGDTALSDWQPVRPGATAEFRFPRAGYWGCERGADALHA